MKPNHGELYHASERVQLKKDVLEFRNGVYVTAWLTNVDFKQIWLVNVNKFDAKYIKVAVNNDDMRGNDFGQEYGATA